VTPTFRGRGSNGTSPGKKAPFSLMGAIFAPN
jgi:hypothetical protein